MFTIRPALDSDWPAIWPIFQDVVSTGAEFVFSPDTAEGDAKAIWMPSGASVFAAELDGQLVGSYYLKPNYPGLGSHVCNAGYMLARSAFGKGVGRAMGVHSIEEAITQGYEAMQFNFVVSTNTRAVELWKSLGFDIVGTLPRAFRHAELGLVDAYVMHRFLREPTAR